MNICAVVAEYNPLHNGHHYQITKARQEGATHIVAVMSGNFVQRGEPAIAPKHMRAKAALLCGVDLVLELPLPYACATAERFAFGAICTLEALGCVNQLSFGSECGDITTLQTCAEALENPALYEAMGSFLDKGEPFAKARSAALAQLYDEDLAQILAQPNNILATEYIRHLTLMGSAMQPSTILRCGAMHDGMPVGDISSASFIRELLSHRLGDSSRYMPNPSFNLLVEAVQGGIAPASGEMLERAILARLRSMTKEDFAALPDLSEGLEHRLYDGVQPSRSLTELLDCCKTKRYTMARIRRLVYSAFLGIPADAALSAPPYIRVLGFNDRGAEVLATAKGTARLPFSHSLARLREVNPLCAKFAALEAKAGDLYALALPTPLPCGLDYSTQVVRIS